MISDSLANENLLSFYLCKDINISIIRGCVNLVEHISGRGFGILLSETNVTLVRSLAIFSKGCLSTYKKWSNYSPRTKLDIDFASPL